MLHIFDIYKNTRFIFSYEMSRMGMVLQGSQVFV